MARDYFYKDINKYVTLEAEDFNSYNGKITLVYHDILPFLDESIPVEEILDSKKIDQELYNFFEDFTYSNEIKSDVVGYIYIPSPIGEFLDTGKIKTYDWEKEIRDDMEKDYKLYKRMLLGNNLWPKTNRRGEYVREQSGNKYDDYLDFYTDYDSPISSDWYLEVLAAFIIDQFVYFVDDIVKDMKRIRHDFIKQYKKIEETKFLRTKPFRLFKEGIEIERGSKEVIAKVTGKESEIFTKIGKKLLEIEEAERKLKELKEEVKDSIRNEKIVDIFDQVEDKLKTRKIQTLSLILTISKDPAPRKTVAYKQVLDELLEMFPELVEKYNELVEKYTTITQLEPTVKATPFFKEAEENENVGFFGKIKNWFVRVFDSWLKKYDMRLKRLQKKVESLKSSEEE